MPETKRLNPLDWFVGTCFTVLAGAVALTIAVHLIENIWVWLAVGIGVVVLLSLLTTLLIWWHRRQSW